MDLNKVFGATLIVAGTSIGAGMLALPIATAAIGFWPALGMMTALWLLSGYSALLMLEVNLKVGAGTNLHGMTGQVLGRVGQGIALFAMLALLYALTAAYLSGGASLLTLKLASWLSLSAAQSACLFALLFGGVVAWGVRGIDGAIRLLFALKLLALLAILLALLPQISAVNLVADLASRAQGQGALIAAIPVMITSFGFHAGIPPLVRYLDGEIRALRRVFLLGSALPLLCYALWLLAALGTTAPEAQQGLLQGDGLTELIALLSAASGQRGFGQILTLFADLALLTSFIGVTLSLFEYLAELCRRDRSWCGRGQTWVLTFVPPLLLAIYLPEGFVAVLGFAAIPLVILMVVLPAAMALKLRRTHPGYQVGGGRAALGLSVTAGLGVVGAQLLTAM
ncbi:aromatic amino acid transport family protein [Ferrimonas pelagia]|uniref:Aromatic amino acid transport family protein n=1 Tax=Ferrimonas pelagia TaxID=1177826 RepID=A0ABP9FA67_9GAMM